MPYLNKVILMGNITADPELKQTQSGLAVTSFSVAVNRRFAKEGEQSVDFINVVAWRQSAEFVCRFFKKGSNIVIVGQLQARQWTDNSGQKRTAYEVVADEVSFGAKAENLPAVATNAPPPTNSPAAYTPSAYTQPQFAVAHMPQFEEIPNDEQLPF